MTVPIVLLVGVILEVGCSFDRFVRFAQVLRDDIKRGSQRAEVELTLKVRFLFFHEPLQSIPQYRRLLCIET